MFIRHARAVRAAFAADLAADESAFSGEQLTVLDRRNPPSWPYTAAAVTFGTGTVLSIDPAYRAFLDANLPKRHYEAAHPETLAKIAAEAQSRGAAVTATAPELGFTLAELPPEPTFPAGLEWRTVDQAWMAAEQASGRFEHGVGEPDKAARNIRNLYGAALFESGEPIAIGGVFSAAGMHEIGVDVVRAWRGQGLGGQIVAAAARLIIERDGIPVYFCAATNVRSHRTALSTGFMPLFSTAHVA